MSDFAIRFENLSRKYRIRHEQQERYLALRDVIAGGVKGLGASAGNGHQPRNGASDYLIPNTQHLTPCSC